MLGNRRGKKKRCQENQRMTRRGRQRDRHTLEVNPRSRMADRMKMMGRLKFATLLVLCCILALGLISGVKAGLNRLFFDNPEFKIADIYVVTDGTLTRTQVLEQAELSEGDFSLGVDLEKTRQKIESLPHVTHAKVERKMPGQIEITIKEREVVAWLDCSDLNLAPFRTRNGCLIASDGVAMPCHSLRDEFLGLPIVRVDHIARVKFGERIDSDPVRGALKLIALNEEMLYEEQLGIREIEALNPFSLLAVFANDAEVTFGLDDLERQMRDFKIVMDNAQVHGWRIATLNLLVEKNVPVTFFSDPPADFDNPVEGTEGPPEGSIPSGHPELRRGAREADARAILGTLY